MDWVKVDMIFFYVLRYLTYLFDQQHDYMFYSKLICMDILSSKLKNLT